MLINRLLSRPDTKWVLTTFSVMGFLNLASRMAVVYTGAGIFAVAMAFIGIGGWIHGIASIARSAQICDTKKELTTLMVVFFALGCLFALPWHFFTFGDVPSKMPGLYLFVQTLLAAAYAVCRAIPQRTPATWYVRHLILGYATYACLFQSVAPKVQSNWLSLAADVDLTLAFAGSTFLIFTIMVTDIACVLGVAARKVPINPRRN